MLERITVHDAFRGVYVVVPDAPQGQHIQRLGKYEDRDTAEPVKFFDDSEQRSAVCPTCGKILVEDYKDVPQDFQFCFGCGQRIKWEV